MFRKFKSELQSTLGAKTYFAESFSNCKLEIADKMKIHLEYMSINFENRQLGEWVGVFSPLSVHFMHFFLNLGAKVYILENLTLGFFCRVFLLV